MCDEAADDSLAALKLIPDWFVVSKMIKKLYTTLYADKHILYFDEDSGYAVFYCNEMGILSVYLNNINLVSNFGDPDTIILIRLLAWHNKFERRKALKKKISEKLMPIVWHPKRWWIFCMSEDEKKEKEPFNVSNLILDTVQKSL